MKTTSLFSECSDHCSHCHMSSEDSEVTVCDVCDGSYYLTEDGWCNGKCLLLSHCIMVIIAICLLSITSTKENNFQSFQEII